MNRTLLMICVILVGCSTGHDTNPRLESLLQSCAQADTQACDQLYWTAPIDSHYYEYAVDRGGQKPAQERRIRTFVDVGPQSEDYVRWYQPPVRSLYDDPWPTGPSWYHSLDDDYDNDGWSNSYDFNDPFQAPATDTWDRVPGEVEPYYKPLPDPFDLDP